MLTLCKVFVENNITLKWNYKQDLEREKKCIPIYRFSQVALQGSEI